VTESLTATIAAPMSPTPPTDERFRPRERLRLEKDFERVIKKGKRAGDDRLLVYALANDLGWSRLGISVPKRIGNAVRRHYVRRRIREAFRRHKPDFPPGFDFACVARPRAVDPDANLVDSLVALTRKATTRIQERR